MNLAKPRFRIVALAFVAGVLASVAFAHEFWVQPDAFRPAVGAATGVRLFIGDGLPGEHRPRDARKLERLDIVGPEAGARQVPIDGKDGADPVGTITPTKPGVYAVVYRGKESTISLAAEEFEEYVRGEGLTDVIKKRAELNESKAAGGEAYSRCAKSLLCAGGESHGAWDVKTGLAVEIVPQSNPYAAHAGDTIAFLLLRDGKPVADAQLMALTRDSGKTIRTIARTDASGKASFTLQQSGLWVINTVRMDRVDPKAGRTDVDWVSIWSSLSFDLARAE
ncbi:MAG: DUF4198 domain-containing protein [Phycisphaerales bacterium]|nr:DUF4198 domain-containing protein [Planctomycetota bacterium]